MGESGPSPQSDVNFSSSNARTTDRVRGLQSESGSLGLQTAPKLKLYISPSKYSRGLPLQLKPIRKTEIWNLKLKSKLNPNLKINIITIFGHCHVGVSSVLQRNNGVTNQKAVRVVMVVAVIHAVKEIKYTACRIEMREAFPVMTFPEKKKEAKKMVA
ncbi:hypothetical protein LXL04_029121 [Taraxacum kok-saghyz]